MARLKGPCAAVHNHGQAGARQAGGMARLLVPANMSLAKLHRVLQVAMGWTNSQLHQFESKGGGTRAGHPAMTTSLIPTCKTMRTHVWRMYRRDRP